MRKPIIAGNWKMHKTHSEVVAFAEKLERAGTFDDGVETIIAPSFTSLGVCADLFGPMGIGLAGQNMHWADSGAYTGEVSAQMLVESGCTHVILGHSERRQYFGETDEAVGKKAVKALESGLTPIVCIGETIEERRAGKEFEVVEAQLDGCLTPVADRCETVVLAYEPVWAIGTGETATSAQAQQMHEHIRGRLGAIAGRSAADSVRILYGGSVKPENVRELLGCPDVDGGLVGGASLDAETFASIVRFRV